MILVGRGPRGEPTIPHRAGVDPDLDPAPVGVQALEAVSRVGDLDVREHREATALALDAGHLEHVMHDAVILRPLAIAVADIDDFNLAREQHWYLPRKASVGFALPG